MKQGLSPVRLLGLVGLAALCLWSESKLSAQVRSAPALRDPLPTYAPSNSPKPGESEPPAALTPTRAVEEDKRPLVAAPGPSTVPTPASDKVQVTGLRFLSSKNFTRVMMEL